LRDSLIVKSQSRKHSDDCCQKTPGYMSRRH